MSTVSGRIMSIKSELDEVLAIRQLDSSGFTETHKTLSEIENGVVKLRAAVYKQLYVLYGPDPISNKSNKRRKK